MIRRSLRHCVPCVALVALAPATAQAQSASPRVALAPFVGERSALVRSIVAGILSDHADAIDVVSQNDLNDALNRVGSSDLDDAAVLSRVSDTLHLDRVILGAVEPAPSGYRVVLRVVRARDGRPAGTASWELRRLDELQVLGPDIWSQLARTLGVGDAAAPPPPSGGPSSPSQPATPHEGAAAQPQGEVVHAPGIGWLHLWLGGGLAGRSWRMPVLGERSARGYENGAFGELRGGLRLLFRTNPPRWGFGLDTELAVPVALSSQGRDDTGRTVPLASSGYQVYVGLTAMHRPASGGGGRFTAGFVAQEFDLDTARLPAEQRLADAQYLGLRVAGEASLPFYARRDVEFSGIVGGELRVVAVGGDLKSAFGANPSVTLALGAWAGLATRLDRFAPGLGFRVTAEFVRYRTAFAGTASIGTGSDSVDDYTRYSLAVTYDFGAEHGDRGAREHERASTFLGSATEPSAAQPATTEPARDPYTSR